MHKDGFGLSLKPGFTKTEFNFKLKPYAQHF
jgi:hypothetical protein